VSTILEAVESVVAALEGAGVPVTADPGVFAPLVSAQGAAALVGPPSVTLARLDGTMEVECPVYLACPAPGGLAEFTALWEALALAARALAYQGPTDPGSVTAGDITLPCYTLAARRRATP
jgi:hypothetical protein